jgi:Zn-dependent protease
MPNAMPTHGWRRAALVRGLTLASAATATAVLRPQFSGRDPVELVMNIILFVICLGIHEAAHGWVALRCGDPTARDLGRITLNPLPHIDLFMTIILPTFVYLRSGGTMLFGGAKPVPVNFHRLRHPWRDMSLVALAGPASNLLLGMFFLAAWKFFLSTGLYNGAAQHPLDRAEDFLPRVLASAMQFNVLLAVFNMVPIPPLDGSRVMAWLLPDGIRGAYVGLERIGMLVIFGLLYLVPSFNHFLGETINSVIGFLDLLIPIRLQG